MEALQNIKNKLAEFEQSKQAIIKEIQREFPDMIEPIFNKATLITSIGWRQYSPWNDGEDTSFEINAELLVINGKPYYEDEYKDDYGADGSAIEDFRELLKALPVDILKDVFGESNEITIGKDGAVSIKPYDD